MHLLRARVGSFFLTCTLATACATSSAVPEADPPTHFAKRNVFEFDGHAVDPTNIGIMLDRTTCFGSCPAYVVTVHGDGRVDWRGNSFVEQVGDRFAQVDPLAARLILR